MSWAAGGWLTALAFHVCAVLSWASTGAGGGF